MLYIIFIDLYRNVFDVEKSEKSEKYCLWNNLTIDSYGWFELKTC